MQRNVTYWGNWRVLSRCCNECSWSWCSRLHIITWRWGWETWKSRYEIQRIWGLIWATDIRKVVGIRRFVLCVSIRLNKPLTTYILGLTLNPNQAFHRSPNYTDVTPPFCIQIKHQCILVVWKTLVARAGDILDQRFNISPVIRCSIG